MGEPQIEALAALNPRLDPRPTQTAAAMITPLEALWTRQCGWT
jgi:hypothetical protein